MVTCALVGPPSDPPRVAYAVGRKAGGAVARNKVRRRLRAATRTHVAQLVPGRAYLVSVVGSPDSSTFAELSDSLHGALCALREERS